MKNSNEYNKYGSIVKTQGKIVTNFDGEDGCKCFKMTVNEIYEVKEYDTVVVGTIDIGTIKISDKVELNDTIVTVVGIELNNKMIDIAKVGDTVGLFLKGINGKDIQIGDIVIEDKNNIVEPKEKHRKGFFNKLFRK
jgi:translation elongation factor EF-Tu-like GTPase